MKSRKKKKTTKIKAEHQNSGQADSVDAKEIEKRAFEIYQDRQKQGINGDHDTDWNTAKKELQEKAKAKNAHRKSPVTSPVKKSNWMSRFVFTSMALLLVAGFFIVNGRMKKKPSDKIQKVTPQYVLDLTIGEVHLSHDNGKNWIIADPGIAINQNDVLRTEKDSYCDIIMPGRGILRILPVSEVYLSELSKDTENLYLVRGKVAVNITKKVRKNEVFEVETDIAAASVRGTQFFIENDNKNMSAVLLEGTLGLQRKLDYDAPDDVKKILEQEMEVKILKNQKFSVSQDENSIISDDLSSKLKDVTDIKKIKDYVTEYQVSEQGKMKTIENPEYYKNEMKELNTPDRLDKISAGVLQYTINFESGNQGLSRTSQIELNKIIQLYQKNPSIKIEVQGHTDDEGSYEENLRLSKQRAQSVLQYLVNNGVDQKHIISNGYGDSQPVADNKTEEGKWKNRRTVIKVFMY